MQNKSESKTAYSIVIATVLLVVKLGAAGSLKWKFESDRAACLMNQRNIQQATRSYQGINGLSEGAPLDRAWILREVFNGIDPCCPSGSVYTWSPTVPAVGTPAAPCPHGKHEFDPGTDHGLVGGDEDTATSHPT